MYYHKFSICLYSLYTTRYFVVILKILLKYEHCKWLPKQFFWPQNAGKKHTLMGFHWTKGSEREEPYVHEQQQSSCCRAAFSLFSWQWADFCVKSMHVIIILHPVAKLMGRCFLNAFFHNTYYSTIECETKKLSSAQMRSQCITEKKKFTMIFTLVNFYSKKMQN